LIAHVLQQLLSVISIKEPPMHLRKGRKAGRKLAARLPGRRLIPLKTLHEIPSSLHRRLQRSPGKVAFRFSAIWSVLYRLL
jgi:hypothetical protein